MTRAPVPRARRAGGFSIVELMVSVVIGMLALMFATSMVGNGEQKKQAALGGSDSMQNGMMAMFSISNDVSQAGFGLNDPLLAGCDTTMADNGGAGYRLAFGPRSGATIAPLAAAVIVNHALNPDEITLYAGTGNSGTASVRLQQAYTGGTTLSVDHPPFGFMNDDVIVVAPELPGAKCSLVQLSQDMVPGDSSLHFDSGGGRRFNSTAGLGNMFPVRARVFNLGQASSLAFHTWTVANGFLQLSAVDVSGSETTPATVTDNIVSIKAQYGFDQRTGATFTPESGAQVTVWSPLMIDADGDGVIGSAGDYQRISAIRLAVVARSKTPDRPELDGSCKATQIDKPPTVFTTVQPKNVAAVPVVVNVVVAGDTVPWNCYHYRVFETIVPIRNSAWRPTAWAK